MAKNKSKSNATPVREDVGLRSSKRKEARRQAQESAHQRNLELVKLGQLTPWQQVKAKRNEARAEIQRSWHRRNQA